MYENMHKDDDIWWSSVTFLQHSNQALLASRTCISAAISFFRFKSKPQYFQIERENQLSTVTLWSRRPDVKLTLFASAASSALLQLFSCMSCETGPSLQRARQPGQDLWGSFPSAQCAFHLPRSLWGVVGLHPSLKYIRANYSSLPYPSQPASPKIQSAFLHPKMQISALGLVLVVLFQWGATQRGHFVGDRADAAPISNFSLAWQHIEGFGADRSESASYHQPPVTQTSPLAAGMLRSRMDVIEAMRNWGDASRNPSRSPWPFQRLHTRLGEGMKSRALWMVAILELWVGHFGNGQFSQCQLKVLFLYWDDVYCLFSCWCWTLKSPRPFLSTALSNKSMPWAKVGFTDTVEIDDGYQKGCEKIKDTNKKRQLLHFFSRDR